MSLEEARTVWLTKVGSGWIHDSDVLSKDDLLWEAFCVLARDKHFENEPNTSAVKLKCKS